MTRKPITTHVHFLSRDLVDDVNSCGNTSKNVMYKNVPVAMHCKPAVMISLASFWARLETQIPIAIPKGDARANIKIDIMNLVLVKPFD